MLVQVLSEASLVPHNEMQSETASDDYGTSQDLHHNQNLFLSLIFGIFANQQNYTNEENTRPTIRFQFTFCPKRN